MKVLIAAKNRLISLKRVQKMLLLTCLVFLLWGISRLNTQNTATPSYQTTQVQRSTLVSTVTTNGSVVNATASILAPAQGFIQSVAVKNGDTVVAGQELARVVSTATALEKAQTLASYLSAKNNVIAAESKLHSLQSTLFKANQTFVNGHGTSNPDTDDPTYIIQNAEWLQAEADYKNQTNIIAQAKASLSASYLSYQATQNAVIAAPVDGTIANLAIIKGSTVTPETTVARIGQFTDFYLLVTASEIDVSKLKADQKATITFDAIPDVSVVGTVQNVDTIGSNNSGVVTYNVYILLSSNPPSVKPGMTASASIQIDRAENVLHVPSSSVQTTNGSSVVRLLKDGNPTSVEVTTGISSDSETAILTGLSEGDTVITGTINQTANTSQSGTSPFSAFGRGGATFIGTRGGGR